MGFVRPQLVDENGNYETPMSGFLLELIEPPINCETVWIIPPFFGEDCTVHKERAIVARTAYIEAPRMASTWKLCFFFLIRKRFEILAHEIIAAFKATENRLALVCQCDNRSPKLSAIATYC